MSATDTGSDPEAPAKIIAHMIARVGDRFGVVRKFSRHMEGQEKRAGLLADAFSAFMALYARNPDLINELGEKLREDIQAKQAVRKMKDTTASVNGHSTVGAMS